MKRKPKYSVLRRPPHAIKDFIDFDYTDQLSDKDLAWLNEFSKSYYQGCASDRMSKGDSFILDSTGKPTTGKKAGFARYNSAYRDVMTRHYRIKTDDFTDDNNSFNEEG